MGTRPPESPRRDPREPFSPPDSPKRCYDPKTDRPRPVEGRGRPLTIPSPSPRSIPRSSELLARRDARCVRGARTTCARSRSSPRPASRSAIGGTSLFAGRRGAAARGRRRVADVLRRPARTRARAAECHRNTPNSERLSAHRATFLKSLRWALEGVAHAAGLAVVCAVFFSAKGRVSLDGVGDVTDKVVGASMVLLGVLALVQLRAWRRRRARARAPGRRSSRQRTRRCRSPTSAASESWRTRSSGWRAWTTFPSGCGRRPR